jgi:UPF0271 protein
MLRIDLNADLGEASGPEALRLEEAIVPQITSMNIACGFHAGHPDLMRHMVRLARAHGVAIGAHPGLRDPASGGRQELPISPGEVENLVAYQIGALAAIAAAEGATLSHVKPHGALYGMGARDQAVAAAIARAVAAVDRRLVLYGLAGSRLMKAAEEAGLRAAAEGFADRAYQPDGLLVPRGTTGAVISDQVEVVGRALRLVTEGMIRAVDGTELSIRIDTLCLHGDTPDAAALSQAVRAALTEAEVQVRALRA